MREWPEDRAIAEMDEQASVALLKLLAFAAGVGAVVGVAAYLLLRALFH